MIRRCLLSLALILWFSAFSFAATKEKKKEEPVLRHVGFSFRLFPAPDNYNWRGSNDRALSVVIWYPAESTAEEKDQYIGDPPLFYAGRAAKDATLAPSFGNYPLVALSHGTGGSAMQMAWMGTYLAARGYIVVAVNHPGNNAVTGYTPQGFVEGWERARDVTTAITGILADPRFGSRIDRDRIGAAGFSYGGYTVLELAGARTDVKGLLQWCETPEGSLRCDPPEMPDVFDRFEAIKQQPDVQKALREGGDSYRDPRIKAVFAIAPLMNRAFSSGTLEQINIPVAIVAGSADMVLRPGENAALFGPSIKGVQLTILPGDVGHYTFLDVGTDLGKKRLPQLFVDNPGVDREAVHQQVAGMTADFFDKAFTPPRKKKK